MASIHLVVLLMALASALCEDMVRDNLDYHLLKLSNQFGTVNGSRYRLPTSVVPLKYNLKLIPYIIEGNFTFDGQVDITVEAVESVQKITFHVYQLKLDSKLITVKELLAPHNQVVVKDVEEEGKTNFYTLNLATLLKEKTRYVISIQKYTGILNGDMTGFYRSSYKANGTVRWLATTHFEATHARQAFPCFDEPALKARLTISISRPEGLRAISNMPQAGQPQLDTEHTDEVRYWDHFQETPLMSTYLVAFVVSDFKYLDEKMRIFAEPQLVEHTRYALSHSKGILDWLADYVGVSYDMPKMDQVAVPDFGAGAMENWGLVLYRRSLLLVDEKHSAAHDKQFTSMIIAHEFAHQWFGDLVSPQWWKYLWLNEGFATYFAYIAVAQREPSWRMDEQFVVRKMQTALHFDASGDMHSMTVNVSTPNDIRVIFNAISYDKSGSVLRMMESITTTKTFRKGLQHYLKSKSYSSATAEDLFDCLSKQMQIDNVTYKVDFKDVMRTWTLQSGFPVVNVTRDYQKDEAANVSQLSFHNSSNGGNKPVSKWYIPLTYTNLAESDFETTRPKNWLDPRDTATTSRITNLGNNSQWVLFNVKATGYYRVNYDERNWELLTAFLKTSEYKAIPPVNRAQLLDDAFQLAKFKKLEYRVALNLSTYLRQETDYIAWLGVDRSFSELSFRFENTAGFETFRKFLRHLLNKTYEVTSLEAGEADDHITKLNRAAIAKFAILTGEEDFANLALEKVRMMMLNPDRNLIDPDLREAFYCAAAKHGGSKVYNFFQKQQQKNTFPSEKAIIVRARGCSKNPELLRSFLDEALVNDSRVTLHEREAVFQAVYAHPSGVDVALQYILHNFKKVQNSFGHQLGVIKMIYKLASLSNTSSHAQRLEQLLVLYASEVKIYSAVIKKAIDTIGKNNIWYDNIGKVICQWITEYFASLKTSQQI